MHKRLPSEMFVEVMRRQLLSSSNTVMISNDVPRPDPGPHAVARGWSHLGVMLLSAICSNDLMSSSPGGGIRSRNSLGTDTTHSGSSRP